ncbi:MAG TPA: tyrosine-type recombinase/integrase [Acidimicrobiales bacterium]|jgi:integrase|nr:tyrosine-type recombinase/integrase [Acidimicrobiales bacterium]
MSGLHGELERYLAIRRALGFKLARAELLLADYLRYLDTICVDTITTENAFAWATQPANGSLSWWGQRLSVVRAFARHLHAIDPRHEVPPAGLLAAKSHRAVPYLYSDADIAALMAAARQLRSPLRAATLETLIGLLAVSGLRIGEALRLDRDDVDLQAGVLRVRQTKFGKTREVPLHPSTVDALAGYARRRDELCCRPRDPSFFVSTAGTRLLYCNAHLAWLDLVRRAGLKARSPRCRPRPHDLRHGFAVRTLLGWYRSGVDVEAHMPLLSTYLGHVHPANTYWYLSAAPELLALVAARLDSADGARP